MPLLRFGKHDGVSLPFEPDDVITELDTDVGETGESVCWGDVLIELERDVGESITWLELEVGTGALYVHTIRSCSELCDSSESCLVSSSVFSELVQSSSISMGIALPSVLSRCDNCR